MPGRVKAAFPFLLLLLLVDTAFGQCNWTARSSVQFRASVLDLAPDGNDLWAATGYGVQLLDRTVDPPAPIASIALPDTTRVVRTGPGGFVYAGSGSRIYVLRRNGRAIQLVRSVSAGATVNDIVVSSALFAATANGIAHFDLVDPANPTRTSVTMQTSGANVTSLSLAGTTLYAADGDATVETFSVSTSSSPQRTGALESLPRSTAVNATTSRVYVSDGQNTDIFVNGIRVARVPFGSISLATIATDEHFVAGPDRAVHAIDFSVGNSPVELYEAQLAPTPGTINRISAMQIAGNRLYVAAGDIGLASFDLSQFATPHPVRSLASGPATSAMLIGTTAYVTPVAGGISEFTTSANFLTFSRTQNTDRTWVLHDRQGAALLAVSGARAELSSGYAATFPKTILSAVSNGQTVIAVLDDNTVWSVATATDATPQQVALGAMKPSLTSRSGNAIALTEVTEAGDTKIHYFAGGVLTAAPLTFTLTSAAPIGNVALSATHAALATHQGAILIDLVTGNVSLLPGSPAYLPRQFVFAGARLLELTDRSLLVWDVAGRRLVREIPLPADALAMDADASLAVIATADGVTSVSFEATQGLPQPLPIRNANRYYTKLVASDDRLYTFGENGIDIYSTSIGYTPLFVTGLRVAGMIDLAASDDHLFTLAGSSSVTTHGPDGNAIVQATITDGAESRPMGIASVGGVPWVTLATNCLAGICREKKTFVLDSLTLAVTATITGGVIDVVTSGTRAYALFDTPAEIRIYSLADPKHPSQIVGRSLDGVANSIAYANGVVHVAGARVRSFDEATLSPATTAITPVTPDAIERIRIDGGCAVLTGRTFSPELHPTAGSASTLPQPGAVRGLATRAGRLYFLTDTSIEVWSSTAATQPSRRRPTR